MPTAAIGQRMVKSIQMNFLIGGRPRAWKPVKSGDTPLVRSGKLMRSIRYIAGDKKVTIRAGEGLPYATIHQFGGTFQIPVTEKSRSFFWAKWYETGDDFWKWCALTKQTQFTVTIDARPYMLFQLTDILFIKQAVGSAILITAGGEEIPI